MLSALFLFLALVMIGAAALFFYVAAIGVYSQSMTPVEFLFVSCGGAIFVLASLRMMGIF